jgi:hypothetical protein
MPTATEAPAAMCSPGSTAVRAVLCSMLLLGTVLGMVFAPAGLAAGEDFRVENEVFFHGNDKADSRSTTIFHDARVYDYLEDPAEVIVFDESHDRFVLLDTARRIRTELTTARLTAFTEQLRQRAAVHEDALVRFLAAPRFEEQFDGQSGVLALSSRLMTYRLTLLEVPSPAIAQQYREFSDWYARLNTLLHPGSKPPFARLAVNAALAKRDAIPREVRLALPAKEGSSSSDTTVRSSHRLVRPLTEADRKRVDQTGKDMQAFRLVDFDQYRRGQD